MRILPGMLLGLLNLVCIGLDIVLFLAVVRLVLMWRRISWLDKLNDIGKGLVDALAANAGQLWYRATQKKLSYRGELLVSILALSILRLLISEIAMLF